MIAASEHALNNINILNHDGGHPRKGAVDLIPIHQSTLKFIYSEKANFVKSSP